MSDNNNHHLDAEVLPADQRRAADLTEGCVRGDGPRVADLLAELFDAGTERTLAVTALLARNLAVVLVTSRGRDGALRVLESTRLDAAVAE